LIIFYLHWTEFGTHQPHNGFLGFSLDGPAGQELPIPVVLNRYCSHFTLISVQDNGPEGTSDYAYHVMVRDAARNEQIINELSRISGLENIQLTMQEQMLEV